MKVKIVIGGVVFDHETVTVRWGVHPVEGPERTIRLHRGKEGSIEVAPQPKRDPSSDAAYLMFNYANHEGEEWKHAEDKHSERYLYEILAAAQKYLRRHALMPMLPAPIPGKVPDVLA